MSLQRKDVPCSFFHLAVGNTNVVKISWTLQMKSKKTEGAWTTGWPTLRLQYKAKLIFTCLSCCYRVCYTHLTQILINTIFLLWIFRVQAHLRCHFRGAFPFLNIFNVLFVAALSLCCCTRAFSSCGEQGLLVAEKGLLIAVASLVSEHCLSGARV